MNFEKLSFEEFATQAENTNQAELLETVQGGSASECHGFWGGVGKSIDAAVDGFIKGLTSN